MKEAARASTRRGMAAVVAVVLLVMLQLLAGVLLSGGAREIEQRSMRLDGLRSFYAAEGAVNMAVRELMLGADEDGDGTVGGVSLTGTSADDPRLGPARLSIVAVSTSGSTTTIAAESASGAAMRRQRATIIVLGPAQIQVSGWEEIP